MTTRLRSPGSANRPSARFVDRQRLRQVQAHDNAGAGAGPRAHIERGADEVGTLTHADEPQRIAVLALDLLRFEAASIVLDGDFEVSRIMAQHHCDALATRVF